MCGGFSPLPPARRSQRGRVRWPRYPCTSAAPGRAQSLSASSCLCRPWTSGMSSPHAPSPGFPSHCGPDDRIKIGHQGSELLQVANHYWALRKFWFKRTKADSECGQRSRVKLDVCVCVCGIWGVKWAWKAATMRSHRIHIWEYRNPKDTFTTYKSPFKSIKRHQTETIYCLAVKGRIIISIKGDFCCSVNAKEAVFM